MWISSAPDPPVDEGPIGRIPQSAPQALALGRRAIGANASRIFRTVGVAKPKMAAGSSISPMHPIVASMTGSVITVSARQRSRPSVPRNGIDGRRQQCRPLFGLEIVAFAEQRAVGSSHQCYR
jgi:hypothetical protein